MAKPKLPVTLILDNVRSAYNVGAIFRTADAVNLQKIILTGLSPHPKIDHDPRTPHVIARAEKMIAKTALGAEKSVQFDYAPDLSQAIKVLRNQGSQICALEQHRDSVNLFKWQPRFPLVLIVGHEVKGTDTKIMALTDDIIEIPMTGAKESLNVSVAAGIALYWLLQKW